MNKERRIRILVAMIILIVMLLSQYLLISLKFFAYATSNEYYDDSTNSNSVAFKCEIENNEHSMNSTDIKLVVNLETRREGIFQGKIILENSNFKFIKKEQEGIENINDTEIILAKQEGIKSQRYEIDIEPVKDENYELENLSKESEIRLEGKYQVSDDNIKQIEAKKKVRLTLENPYKNEEKYLDINTKILTNGIYQIEEQNKRVLQIEVESRIKENAYPVKESNLEIKIPQEAEKVEVLSRGTEATNGKNELEFGSDNWEYNTETGIIKINIKNNEENGKVSWKKDVNDKYIINLTFSEDFNINEMEVGIFEESFLWDEKSNTSEELTINEFEEGKENIVGYEINGTDEIYKGKIYSQEETEFETESKIDITYSGITSNLVFYESVQKYILEDTEIEAEGQYRQSIINKEELVRILGEEGKLIIKDINGNEIQEINKDTETNEEGNIEVRYNEANEKLIIEISKAEGTGIIRIKNKIVIKAEDELDTLRKIKSVIVSGNISDEKLKEEVKAKKEIKTKESKTAAKLKIDNDILSTEEENKNVEMKAILYTPNEKFNLYKNPKLLITLPQEIEEVEINDIDILYDEELKVSKKDAEIIELENGQKQIKIDIEGKQTKHIYSDVIYGANILINCNIKVSKDISTEEGIIKFEYINEGEINYYNDGIEEVKVKYVIPQEKNEFKVEDINNEANISTQEENKLETNNENYGNVLSQPISNEIKITKAISNEDDYILERQVQEYTITIENISGKTLENINIKDTIPEEMIYVTYINTQGYQNIFEEHEEIKEYTNTIDKLEAGENKILTYQAIAKKSEINVGKIIGTKAIAEVNGVKYESNLVEKTIKENDLQVWLVARNDISDATFTEGKSIDLVAKVKNITNRTLNNVQIKDYLPEQLECANMELLECEDGIYYQKQAEETDSSEYTENNGVTTLNIETLNPGEEKAVLIVHVFKKYEKDYESIKMQNQISATADGKEIKSNILECSQYNINETLRANLTSSLTDTFLYEGDEFEYKLTVENPSETYKYEFTLKDVLPTGLLGDEIIFWSDSEYLELMIEEEIEVNIEIAPKESKEIIIRVKADDLEEGVTELEIRNSVTISGLYLTEVKTPELVNIIKRKMDQYESSDEESKDDNQDSNNGQGPGDNQDESSGEQRYSSISGQAWLDSNENGSKDSDEEFIKDMKVRLISGETGNYMRNSEGQIVEVTTDGNGTYKFGELNPGKYIVAFMYDNSKYKLTDYKKVGVNDKFNSDATNYELDDTGTYIGITDIIDLTNSYAENIDIGLKKIQIFDLKLDKYVDKVIIKNQKGTTEKTFKNKTLAKVEFDKKTLNNTKISIEYNIIVTNEGEISGYAKKIIDYLPNGLKFKEASNKNWTNNNGQLIYTGLKDEPIAPGESKTIKLIVTKDINENSMGIITNTAEIYEEYNGLGIKDNDSSVQNKNQNEDDMSSASLILSIKTGAVKVYIIFTITLLIIFVTGIYLIRKKVLEV